MTAPNQISRQGIQLFGDLRKIETDEDIELFELIKGRFGADRNRDHFEVRYGGDGLVAHFMAKNGREGFVIVYRLNDAEQVANSLRGMYGRKGATVLRDYNFHDTKEAGFMWRLQERGVL